MSISVYAWVGKGEDSAQWIFETTRLPPSSIRHEDLAIHWNIIVAVDEPESLFGGFRSFGGALTRAAAASFRYRRGRRICDIITRYRRCSSRWLSTDIIKVTFTYCKVKGDLDTIEKYSRNKLKSTVLDKHTFMIHIVKRHIFLPFECGLFPALFGAKLLSSFQGLLLLLLQ